MSAKVLLEVSHVIEANQNSSTVAVDVDRGDGAVAAFHVDPAVFVCPEQPDYERPDEIAVGDNDLVVGVGGDGEPGVEYLIDSFSHAGNGGRIDCREGRIVLPSRGDRGYALSEQRALLDRMCRKLPSDRCGRLRRPEEIAGTDTDDWQYGQSSRGSPRLSPPEVGQRSLELPLPFVGVFLSVADQVDTPPRSGGCTHSSAGRVSDSAVAAASSSANASSTQVVNNSMSDMTSQSPVMPHATSPL